MLNSLVVSLQLGVPITILTFALVKGNILLVCITYLGVYCAFIRHWIFYSLHFLMNSWYCSVAWLIGWALILEYTIGGSTVARGISPNLVFTLWLIDIFFFLAYHTEVQVGFLCLFGQNWWLKACIAYIHSFVSWRVVLYCFVELKFSSVACWPILFIELLLWLVGISKQTIKLFKIILFTFLCCLSYES